MSKAKVAAATLRTPAVNHHGGLGRWDFLSATDLWNAKAAIRQFFAAPKGNG